MPRHEYDARVLRDRALLASLYKLIDEEESSWLLVDALHFSHIAVGIAVDQWKRGETSEAEVVQGERDLLGELEGETYHGIRLVFREALDFLISEYGDGDHPDHDGGWGEQWEEVMHPDEIEQMGQRGGLDSSRHGYWRTRRAMRHANKPNETEHDSLTPKPKARSPGKAPR